MCGGVDRRLEEETEGGETLSANRTKGSYSKVLATIKPGVQRKEPWLFTKEETEGQKESTEAAVLNQAEPVPQNYHSVNTELAKLVVEIECRGTQSEPKAPLGLEGNDEAQFWSGGDSGECQTQRVGAFSTARKSASEVNDGGNHVRGVEKPNCEPKGNGEDNMLYNPNPNPMMTRNNGGLKLHGLLEPEEGA